MASTLESLAARASIALWMLVGCGSSSMATTPVGPAPSCVSGTPAEREAILSVLDTFTPVRDAPSSP